MSSGSRYALDIDGRRVHAWRLMVVSRGFRGRGRRDDSGRVPPGQYVTDDFPVLSAGPTPHTPLEDWSFSLSGEIDEPKSASGDGYQLHYLGRFEREE